jgi:tetratricopeptide (TPR) repeat protein
MKNNTPGDVSGKSCQENQDSLNLDKALIEKEKKNFGKSSHFLFLTLLALILWQVILRAENPSIMMDDSGETAASAFTLGIPHPPGYPLYNLMGRLATLLPIGTIAFRLNLLSEFFTCLSLFFILDTCRRLFTTIFAETISLISPIGIKFCMAATAISLVFCQSVFGQSLSAKGGIYTLTLFILSVFIWECTGPIRLKSVYWVLFLWAVGLGNHWETQVLWVPFLWFWFSKIIKVRWNLKIFSTAATFVVLGLSTYLYLPLRAHLNPFINWENPENLTAFLRSVLRKPYTTNEEFHIQNLDSLINQIKELITVLFWHWWPGFVLLALIGMYTLFKYNKNLLYLFLLAYGVPTTTIIVVLNANKTLLFDVDDFLVSTQGILAVCGFIGLVTIVSYLSKHVTNKAHFLIPFTFLIVSIGWGYHVFEKQDKSHYLLTIDFGVNILKEIPRGATLFEEGDQAFMPLYYIKNVLGLREDVKTIPVFTLLADWGWKQSCIITEISQINISTQWQRLDYLVNQLLEKNIPVFYSLYDITLQKYTLTDIQNRLYPWGVSNKVELNFPTTEEVETRVIKNSNETRLRSLRPSEINPDDILSIVFFNSYATPHLLTANLLMEKGEVDGALKEDQMAFNITPKLKDIYLELSKFYEKNGYSELAKELCLKEISVSPVSGESYFVLGNINLKMGLLNEAVAAYDQTIKINPQSAEAINNRQVAIERQSNYTSGINWNPEPQGFYKDMGDKFQSKGISFMAEAAYAAENNLSKK